VRSEGFLGITQGASELQQDRGACSRQVPTSMSSRWTAYAGGTVSSAALALLVQGRFEYRNGREVLRPAGGALELDELAQLQHADGQPPA
jgi:hypothetical protein